MASDFAYYYALWKMDELRSEEVPEIACAALESGLDSPALRYLAGLNRPTIWEVRRTFDDACSQVGIIPASIAEVEKRKRESWLQVAIKCAKRISTEILEGTIDPAEGWFQLPYREADLGPMSVFFEIALPDATVRFNDEFRSQVINAAKRFQTNGE